MEYEREVERYLKERIEAEGGLCWKFVTTERAERQGTNPKSGKLMTISASKNVKFRCSDTLKKAVNNK